MEYRKARSDEVTAIMDVIHEAIAAMQSQGIHQWDQHYPTSHWIHKDIEKGSGFVVADQTEILAYVCVNEDQPDEYAMIKWEDEDGKCCVIHRLVVHPKHQGKGIAKFLIAAYEDDARDHGYTSVRLDTFSENPISMRLYPKLGYLRRGEVKFTHRESMFPVFEKKL